MKNKKKKNDEIDVSIAFDPTLSRWPQSCPSLRIDLFVVYQTVCVCVQHFRHIPPSIAKPKLLWSVCVLYAQLLFLGLRPAPKLFSFHRHTESTIRYFQGSPVAKKQNKKKKAKENKKQKNKIKGMKKKKENKKEKKKEEIRKQSRRY